MRRRAVKTPTPEATLLNELYPCILYPKGPPNVLLGAAAAALEDLESVGPAYFRVDLLARFEKAVFDGSRLKTIVDNNPVIWLEKPTSLKQEILRRLQCDGFSLFDTWKHLLLFRQRAKESSGVITQGYRLNEEELVEKGWVYLRRQSRIKYLDSKGTTYDYAILNKDWAVFFVELDRIEREISNLGLKCLVEGRVLAVKETMLGGRLVHPAEWQDVQKIPTKGDPTQFVLTSDLPDTWLYANLGPRGKEERLKKKEALVWLNGLYLQVIPSGKKAIKQDVFRQLESQFQIRGVELQKEIWKEADINLWKMGGAPGMKKKYHFDNEQ